MPSLDIRYRKPRRTEDGNQRTDDGKTEGLTREREEEEPLNVEIVEG
jgi:hypothetical protein